MRLIFTGLIVAALAGCGGKKEEGGEAKPATTTPAEKPAENKPAAIPQPPPSGEPVDVCGMLTKDQIEATSGGKLTGEPTKDEPRGSLLGGCTWNTDKHMIMVNARPAGEYDGTVKASDPTGDVAGIGEKASMTKAGLLVKLPGKPYFLHVMTMTGTKLDNDKAPDIAKLIAK